MLSLLRRGIQTFFGLILFSVGIYFIIRANIGLDPWPALTTGISLKTGLSFGAISVITSAVVLAVDIWLGEKVGLATIIDALVVGPFVNVFLWLDLIPVMKTFTSGVFLLLAGQVVVSIGSYFYIKTGLGCGPRDALMIAIGKRLSRAPIGLVRSLLEGSVLLVGWLLGAKVGLGTLIAVLGTGSIIQITFTILKFDAKAVIHEDALTSIRNARKKEPVPE